MAAIFSQPQCVKFEVRTVPAEHLALFCARGSADIHVAQ